MPGWRVGFCVGNRELVGALRRIKGYLDYGHFTPVQLAAATALADCDAAVAEIRALYRARRDALTDGLAAAGWPIARAEATMFVWAPLPERFRAEGSVQFSMRLLESARVAVAPGVGFGPGGEGYVRFALVEEVERTRAACARIAAALA
jgi:alanine-synthesizing transaminase